MARRILNRRDLRAANDAAERREAEAEEEEDREDEEEDEESDETEDEGDAKAVAKAPAKRKARGSKSVRMKVVWGVFNNSNARVQTFEYSKRAEAQALADKLTTEKKSTHFVNPVKEPMEDKKED
jgi:FtsZ-interacting cell division protein YlmF